MNKPELLREAKDTLYQVNAGAGGSWRLEALGDVAMHGSSSAVTVLPQQPLQGLGFRVSFLAPDSV